MLYYQQFFQYYSHSLSLSTKFSNWTVSPKLLPILNQSVKFPVNSFNFSLLTIFTHNSHNCSDTFLTVINTHCFYYYWQLLHKIFFFKVLGLYLNSLWNFKNLSNLFYLKKMFWFSSFTISFDIIFSFYFYLFMSFYFFSGNILVVKIHVGLLFSVVPVLHHLCEWQFSKQFSSQLCRGVYSAAIPPPIFQDFWEFLFSQASFFLFVIGESFQKGVGKFFKISPYIRTAERDIKYLKLSPNDQNRCQKYGVITNCRNQCQNYRNDV